MFQRLTSASARVIEHALKESRKTGHNYVSADMILVGILLEEDALGSYFLKKAGVTTEKVRAQVLHLRKGIGPGSEWRNFTLRFQHVLCSSLSEADALGDLFVCTQHILLPLLELDVGVCPQVLHNLNVNARKLRKEILFEIDRLKQEGNYNNALLHLPNKSDRLEKKFISRFGSYVQIEKFTIDLTGQAKEKNLDPIIGRDCEIQRVMQILMRRRKNNPVLIGEPGVGKTAIAEGLAQLIISGDVPDKLLKNSLILLDIGLLIAGTKYRGEFEERLRAIVDHMRENKGTIIVIDEIHTLVGAGAAEGAIDAANLLKPALSRGEFQCIGATTIDEYRKYIERDSALERRFQPVKVEEPSVQDSIEILGCLKPSYENHHKVVYAEDAIVASAFMSEQYIVDRFLPDKAIDVLDQTGSQASIKFKKRQIQEKKAPKKKNEKSWYIKLLNQGDPKLKRQLRKLYHFVFFEALTGVLIEAVEFLYSKGFLTDIAILYRLLERFYNVFPVFQNLSHQFQELEVLDNTKNDFSYAYIETENGNNDSWTKYLDNWLGIFSKIMLARYLVHKNNVHGFLLSFTDFDFLGVLFSKNHMRMSNHILIYITNILNWKTVNYVWIEKMYRWYSVFNLNQRSYCLFKSNVSLDLILRQCIYSYIVKLRKSFNPIINKYASRSVDNERAQQLEISLGRKPNLNVLSDLLITEDHVATLVSKWTGVQVSNVNKLESKKLMNLETDLKKAIVGQDEAISAVCNAIRGARLGFRNPNRPIASFIFAGPTGVGKTELAKALSTYFFGQHKKLIRLDMSEFMEKFTVSKLIGAPPGYLGYEEGGQLTEAVRKNPYSMVLFDEIEKAHPDVFNLLLQILEDGRLTDTKGRMVDFKNTILILTSNAGAKIETENSNKSIPEENNLDSFVPMVENVYEKMKINVNAELKKFFRPEFLNRLDDIIVFRQLTKNDLRDIASKMFRELFLRANKESIELRITNRVRDAIVDEAHVDTPIYGARPLRRIIAKKIENRLAFQLLNRDSKNPSMVWIDWDERKNDINIQIIYYKKRRRKSLKNSLKKSTIAQV